MFVDLRKRRRAFSILRAAETRFEDTLGKATEGGAWGGRNPQPIARGYPTRHFYGCGEGGLHGEGGWHSRFALLELDLDPHDVPLAVQLVRGALLHQRAAGARERRHGPARRHHEGGGRGQAKGEQQCTKHAISKAQTVANAARPQGLDVRKPPSAIAAHV